MSWLFGKKRHQKDCPPDPSEEEVPEESEEFTIIRDEPQNFTGGDGLPNFAGTSGLYPYIGGVPTYPTPPLTDYTKKNNLEEAVHYLSGVPFKLCKILESAVNNDFDIDRLRIGEILSFVERIESQNYEYDFSLEKGVVSEMNSTSAE